MAEVFSISRVTQLSCTPYIHYLVKFQKNLEIQFLIVSSIEINVMMPTYAASLGLPIQQTYIEA